MSLEQRVIDLEIRLTHQHKLIESLDEVVREFAARVERLERHAAEGGGDAGAPPGSAAPANDPPPHY